MSNTEQVYSTPSGEVQTKTLATVTTKSFRHHKHENRDISATQSLTAGAKIADPLRDEFASPFEHV